MKEYIQVPKPKIAKINSINNELAEDSRLEAKEKISIAHNITVTVHNNEVIARQINNPVPLEANQKALLLGLANKCGCNNLNIPASCVKKLFNGSLSEKDVITNPVSVILISSKGLLNQSEWTSNQPSEGIWILAEWLSRNEPSAATLCIDPNMISLDELRSALSKYKSSAGLTVLGFSLLPVNLRNDTILITDVKRELPLSIAIAGGIGSESLELLPTGSGKRGITEALPIDLVIPGTAVNELKELVRGVHEGRVKDKSTLREVYDHTLTELHADWNPDEFAKQLADIQKSRETIHSYFIPELSPDIVHHKSYQEANKSKSSESVIVPVLIDNSCGQNCYFCSSSKLPVFSSMDVAADHVARKSENADIIAFNDNDLSNNPVQTIELCKRMMDRGIKQPKHGKIRASRYEPELINALAKAGFVRIAIGIESFSQRIRSMLGKNNFSITNIEQTLEHLIAVNIVPEINLILFSPRETRDTIRETIEGVLKWINRGATAYVTIGLFATPNSPGIMGVLKKDGNFSKKIDFETITVPDRGESLLFPTQWKISDEVVKIKEKVLVKRREIVKSLYEKFNTKVPVPVEAYIAIALLAREFNIDGFHTNDEMGLKIDSYATQNIHNQYVNI